MENDEAKLYRHFINRMLLKFLFNIVLRQAVLKQTELFSVSSGFVFLTNKMHIRCNAFKITDAIAININAPRMLFDISYLSIIADISVPKIIVPNINDTNTKVDENDALLRGSINLLRNSNHWGENICLNIYARNNEITVIITFAL